MQHHDYTCAAPARAVLDRWVAVCIAQSGRWDMFTDPETNTTYRWEPWRKQANGAATGKVWRVDAEGNETETNGFRVEASGSVTRAPRFLSFAAVEPTP